jgi:recombination protein RecR
VNIIPKPVQSLIDELAKLPGIGPKTAQRLTFYLLRRPEKYSVDLGVAAQGLKKNIRFCDICCNITDDETCPVCKDSSRDKEIICVVSEPLDVVAVEKTGGFKGLYHVLGGYISPIDGIGPEDLFIAQLVTRVKAGDIKEVIIATSPTLEGETTALYLQKAITPYSVKITRIARGLPVGGDLEYADEITLARALEGRREY